MRWIKAIILLGFSIHGIEAQSYIITTVAGGIGDGGPGTSAGFYPSGVAVDPAGNVYISDSQNGVVRKVTASTGIITTFAGIGGNQSFSGDGGPATGAGLPAPTGLAFDAAGNLYIADNARIRKVAAGTGIITTVAGGGVYTNLGDNGSAVSAYLAPGAVAVDSSGNLFIADTGNHRIRKVVAATGIITTVAGTGPYLTPDGGYSGDGGSATNALLGRPNAIAVDSAGNI